MNGLHINIYIRVIWWSGLPCSSLSKPRSGVLLSGVLMSQPRGMTLIVFGGRKGFDLCFRHSASAHVDLKGGLLDVAGVSVCGIVLIYELDRSLFFCWPSHKIISEKGEYILSVEIWSQWVVSTSIHNHCVVVEYSFIPHPLLPPFFVATTSIIM